MTTTIDETRPGIDRTKTVLGLIGILLLELAIATRFFRAGPIGDDFDEMAYVHGARSLWNLLQADCYGLFRPVKNGLFYAVSGFPPSTMWPRHCLSLLLFWGCTILAYVWLARRLKNAAWALGATAIWALAPTQVSAIAWFSCANVLFGAGCVLGASLIFETCCAAMEDSAVLPARRVAPVCALLALYALAVLSYESYLVLPALLALQAYWHTGKRPITRRSLHVYIGLAAVAVACLSARTWAQGHYGIRNVSFGPMSSAQVSASSAWFTLDHLSVYLWPFGTLRDGATYVWGVTIPVWWVAVSWCIVAFGVAVTVATRKRLPLQCFGIGWFAVEFLPTSNLIPLRSGPYGDYYLVIPSLGLALATAAAIRHISAHMRAAALPRIRRLSWAPLSLVVAWRTAAVLAGFSWAGAWNSEEDLYRRTLAARPDTFTQMTGIARAELLAGRLDEAVRLAAKSRALAPWQEQALYVLGDVYLRRGETERAADAYRESIRIYPDGVYPYFGLGYIAEVHQHDLAAAEKLYRRVLAVRWNQSSEGAAQNLCRVLINTGKPEQGAELVESTLPNQPDSAPLHYSAAVAWKQAGDMAKAQRHLDRYLALTESDRAGMQVARAAREAAPDGTR